MKCETCGKESAQPWCSVACYDVSLLKERYAEKGREWLWKYREPWSLLEEKNPVAWYYAREQWKGTVNLFLHGPEGVGKSALCRYLLTRHFDRGGGIASVPAARIELYGKYDFRGLDIEPLIGVQLLLIDDLHSPTWSGRGLDVLRLVLDERHERGRRTLVTSNQAPKGLATVFDSVSGTGVGLQILRRLYPVYEIVMTGSSVRPKLNELMEEES